MLLLSFVRNVTIMFEKPCFTKFPEVIFSKYAYKVLLDFLLTVKAATLMFIYWCGSAISSAKKGKSCFIHNLVKSK